MGWGGVGGVGWGGVGWGGMGGVGWVGWGGVGTIGFLSNTGPDPLNNHKATKPAFNVGPLSAAGET